MKIGLALGHTYVKAPMSLEPIVIIDSYNRRIQVSLQHFWSINWSICLLIQFFILILIIVISIFSLSSFHGFVSCILFLNIPYLVVKNACLSFNLLLECKNDVTFEMFNRTWSNVRNALLEFVRVQLVLVDFK